MGGMSRPQPRKPTGRWDIFVAVIFISNALMDAARAHSSGWYLLEYVATATMAAAAVLSAVAAVRGFSEDAQQMAAALMQQVYIGFLIERIAQDVATGESPAVAVFCLVIMLISYNGQRPGRRKLRRLIGEKSRALLAKLVPPEPASQSR